MSVGAVGGAAVSVAEVSRERTGRGERETVSTSSMGRDTRRQGAVAGAVGQGREDMRRWPEKADEDETRAVHGCGTKAGMADMVGLRAIGGAVLLGGVCLRTHTVF